MKPLFSIIIPAHNEEDYIEDVLVACYAQTFPIALFEIIVVDDGSTDKTREIVENFAAIKRDETLNIIKLIHYDTGHSAAFARNRGTEIASGEILVFQDADCIPHKDLLKNASKYFNHYDGIATKTLNTKPASWLQRAVQAQRKTRWEYFETKDKILNKDSGINVAIMKKDVFNKLGGFSQSIFYFEDNDLTKRFFERNYTALFASDVIQYHNDPLTIAESLSQCKSIAKGLKIKAKNTKIHSELLIILSSLLVLTPIIIALYTFFYSKDLLGSIYFGLLWEIRNLAKLVYFFNQN